MLIIRQIRRGTIRILNIRIILRRGMIRRMTHMQIMMITHMIILRRRRIRQLKRLILVRTSKWRQKKSELRQSDNENSTELIVWGININGQLGIGPSYLAQTLNKVSFQTKKSYPEKQK